jgi:hypothetical protein
MTSAYCSEPCTHARCNGTGKVVTLHLSDDELTAVYDWIREGKSRKTVGHVCDVLKRILGGG